jgi:hypothetical protein
VLSIDGAPTEGWDGDRAAASLRGRSGSSVLVRFARRSGQVPGVAGRPEQPPRVEYQQVIVFSPSLSQVFPHGSLGFLQGFLGGMHVVLPNAVTPQIACMRSPLCAALCGSSAVPESGQRCSPLGQACQSRCWWQQRAPVPP